MIKLKDLLEVSPTINIRGLKGATGFIKPEESEAKKRSLKKSIEMGVEVEEYIQQFLKPPLKLEYEKTFWPFILFSKKRYIGNKYEFKTDGDTEIFLLSFILWGENFIEKIEGMFAYVIWQDETNKIYFGRDQFMQKPLYFFNSKEFLILSSEIKPILHALKFYKKEVIFDNNAIKHYLLTNNFTNNKNTFFKSVNQLDVGKIGSLVKGKIKTKKVLKLKKGMNFLLLT